MELWINRDTNNLASNIVAYDQSKQTRIYLVQNSALAFGVSKSIYNQGYYNDSH